MYLDRSRHLVDFFVSQFSFANALYVRTNSVPASHVTDDGQTNLRPKRSKKAPVMYVVAHQHQHQAHHILLGACVSRQKE